MPYKIRYYPRVRHKLRDLPERIRREVSEITLDLANDPYPPTAEELRDNLAGTWKIIDGWRILYEVDEPDREIKIVNVKRRAKDPNRKLT